ncbi:MAG: arginine--tRNA ligase [Thermacetogeniaceae bacterium]
MGVLEKIRREIALALVEAAQGAHRAGRLACYELPEFVVEVPHDKVHGDFASNLALLLAQAEKTAPRKVAQVLLEFFRQPDEYISRTEVAGPGFINFYLDPAWHYEVLPEVDAQGEHYGCIDLGGGESVQVEFVSANPTGLLHMGNARGAALGDTLANVLAAAGYNVQREFYINDAGSQIETFGRSLEARYLQLLGQDVTFPDDGYPGQDLAESMQHLIEQVKDKYLTVDPMLRREMLVKYALKEKLSQMERDLVDFRVHYDVWFSEQTLHESGEIENVLKELQASDYLYEEEGALWFRSTLFGDEKDEVLVRSNGIPTYFAGDIAYHRNKFRRGFDRVINIWGADHHGHVARLKGAMQALGFDPERLQVMIMQLVRLLKGGEPVRMSKRTGEYITLRDLMDDVGVDVARYFFVMRSADSHLDFDLDLAKEQSNENPVYYVQYAHARICSILKQAGVVHAAKDVDCSLLSDPAELALIRKIAELPGEIAYAASHLEPHRLAFYANELATLFHGFYTTCRVLSDEPALSQARLVLINACRIALRNTLHLVGVSAPERM